ncbi:DUF5683 domain-containing protein [Dysgonomonas sp.]|nr:DUF5683 domain-containing protein [Prevotella sp.]
MRIRLTICTLCFLGSLSLNINAQEPLVQDSAIISKQSVKPIKKDTVSRKKAAVLLDTIVFNKPEFKPDSRKALIYSAILPGLGQFYNRKYWKLPIVLGGAFGLTYAITWNGARYNEYRDAYRDLVLNPTTTSSWHDFISPNESREDYLNNASKRESLTASLKRRKDFYRRNRDLAIIAAVGVYALCMIDAYVDAQLYDFDISPDLSMRVEPVVWMPTQYSKACIGLQCKINF